MTTTLPDWATPLTLAQFAWQQFGVPSEGLYLSDILLAMRLNKVTEAGAVKRARRQGA